MYPYLIVARFWSKVDIPDTPHHNDRCWIWRKSTAKGYGQMKVGKRVMRAHRMAYEIAHGPLPEGMHVLHSCDNPMCCNPNHLRAGTHAENMRDAVNRDRVWKGGPKPKDA